MFNFKGWKPTVCSELGAPRRTPSAGRSPRSGRISGAWECLAKCLNTLKDAVPDDDTLALFLSDSDTILSPAIPQSCQLTLNIPDQPPSQSLAIFTKTVELFHKRLTTQDFIDQLTVIPQITPVTISPCGRRPCPSSLTSTSSLF